MRELPMIRFGVVGTGKITRSFLAAARQCEGFALAAVCSRLEGTGQAFVEECRQKGLADAERPIFVFSSPLEMALSGAIDAAYVASPTAMHYPYAKTFLEQGIPVLCEKPFTTNAKEAEELFRIAREKDIFIMEAMRSLAMPSFAAIRKAIPSLGTIRRMVASKCQYSSRYDHFKEGIIENAFRPELSNGSLMDIGRYCVAPAAELFGWPSDIRASAQFLSTGVDAQGSAILQYDGFDAILLYSKVSDSSMPFEIQGEEGTLTAEDIYEFRDAKICFRDGSVQNLESSKSGLCEDDTASEDSAPHVGAEAMVYEIQEALACIRDGRQASTLITPEQTVLSMKIMDAIRLMTGLVYPADES